MEIKIKLIKLIIPVIVIAIILSIFNYTNTNAAITDDYSRLYIRPTKVVNFDFSQDIVTCKDSQGNLWEFIGIEDWELEDTCVLLFDNKGTLDTFKDDVIVRTYYTSYNLSY